MSTRSNDSDRPRLIHWLLGPAIMLGLSITNGCAAQPLPETTGELGETYEECLYWAEDSAAVTWVDERFSGASMVYVEGIVLCYTGNEGTEQCEGEVAPETYTDLQIIGATLFNDLDCSSQLATITPVAWEA